MKKSRLLPVILVILYSAVHLSASAIKIIQKIPYADVGKNVVIIGSLGQPLGTIIKVKGKLFDPGKNMGKEDVEKIFFRIEQVNGKKISQPVVLPLRFFSWLNVIRPVADMSYTYIGYETGGMRGIPPDAFEYIPRVATTAYSFSTYFQILKVVE